MYPTVTTPKCRLALLRELKVQIMHNALESIHNIREAIPELLEADIKSVVAYSGKVAVETSVTA